MAGSQETTSRTPSSDYSDQDANDARSADDGVIGSEKQLLSAGPVLADVDGCYVTRTVRKATILKHSFLHMSALTESVTIVHSWKKDIPSILLLADRTLNRNNVNEVIAKFKNSKSPLLADKVDKTIFTFGGTLEQGNYVYSCIGLRYGQDDSVIAIRIRSRKDASKTSPHWCLFLTDRVREQDAAALSAYNRSVHFLRLGNRDKLRWIASNGRMDTVRAHIDETQATSVVVEEVTDLDERVVILSAEPGTGKSTLMNHVAKQTRVCLPDSVVMPIALNEQTHLFADGTYKDAGAFLRAATGVEAPARKLSSDKALEAGHEVVLLDGFDEVAPTYFKQCCALLSGLLEANVKKVWITSRSSKKRYLEDHLSILATTLGEFTKDDQRKLLKLHWGKARIAVLAKGKSIPFLLDDKVDDFISRLLKLTSEASGDRKSDFAGIPLKTQMLVEIFQDHVTGEAENPKLPDKLDLAELFERYFAKKRSVYLQTVVKLDPQNEHYEIMFRKNEQVCNKNHEHAAISAILNETDLKELRPKTQQDKLLDFYASIKSGLDTTDIIRDIVNGKPRFTHTIFAEYFGAQYFAKRLADSGPFLKNILYTTRFGEVRNIFDRILAKACELHAAVLNADHEETQALLESGAHVNAKDLGGRTALHLAAALGISENQTENKRRGVILDVLIGLTTNFEQDDDVLLGSPLRYADVAQSWTAIDKLLACSADAKSLVTTAVHATNHALIEHALANDLDRLTHFCLTRGLTVDATSGGAERLLPRACQHGSLRVAALLIENGAQIEKISGESEAPLHVASRTGHLPIVKLLRNANSSALDFQERTPLHVASIEGHLGVVKALVAMFPEGACRNNYIHMADKDGWTAIHHAATEGHSEIVSYFLEENDDFGSLDVEIIRHAVCNNKSDEKVVRVFLKARPDIVMTVGANGSNLLHLAAEKCHNSEIVKAVLEVVPAGNRDECINASDVIGCTTVHLASKTGNLASVSYLINSGGKVHSVNYYGRTPLMEACLSGNLDVVKLLLTTSRKECGNSTSYVNKRDKNSRTALHHAISEGHASIVSYLLGEKAEKGKYTKLLYLAVQSAKANAKVLRIVLNAIPCPERAGCVNSVDDVGNTAVHWAAMRTKPDLFELLMKAGGKVTTVNNGEQTPLIIAACAGHELIVEYILDNYDEGREEMSKLEYVNMRDKTGQTALEQAHRTNLRTHAGISFVSLESSTLVIKRLTEVINLRSISTKLKTHEALPSVSNA